MQESTLPRDTLITKTGEKENDLIRIKKGEVLVFVLKGSAVVPLGKLESGDYLGELSFFDETPRSAYALALSEVKIEIYHQEELIQEIPSWMREFGRSLAKKIKSNSRVLEEANFRPRLKRNEIQLNNEEQGRIYRLVKNQNDPQ